MEYGLYKGVMWICSIQGNKIYPEVVWRAAQTYKQVPILSFHLHD